MLFDIHIQKSSSHAYLLSMLICNKLNQLLSLYTLNTAINYKPQEWSNGVKNCKLHDRNTYDESNN